jgi:cAMP-dependent protein kinase regulator
MELHSDSEEEGETEDQDTFDEMLEKRRSVMKKMGQRASVSAEAYGHFNKKEDFTPKFVPKSEAQNKRISECVSHSFMFNSLEEKDLLTVINAMEEKRFESGESVINQGENGDVLYIIESGSLDCFKKFNNDDEEKYLKTYKPGETFGELALLYNAPRAATIRAKDNSVAWSLDRETFNHIVKDAAMKKRAKYETFLSSVDILKSIDSYEITQISDALKIELYKAGDQIIKIDEEGDKFFILEDGLAFASKQFSEEGVDETVVKEYQPGDYFGELALIKNDLRAANVYAKVIIFPNSSHFFYYLD